MAMPTSSERRTPFTVGIPVYNEEAILVPNTERLLVFLDSLGRDYEVIIGSNGSTDSTTALGVDLSRRFPQVAFFHVPQRGVGRAFREFVQRARHPLLISLDMDLSIDLDFVERALDLLEDHEIVVGSKKMGKQKRSFVRRFGSDTFLRMAHLLLGIDYDDYSIAAKAYRVDTARRFIDRINEGSSYVIEMCFLTTRAGGRIVQIPVQCEDWRKSKFNLLHEAVYKYSHLFGLWMKGRRMPDR
jgi:glycosyltransferase involved in cell wall biosynthesis